MVLGASLTILMRSKSKTMNPVINQTIIAVGQVLPSSLSLTFPVSISHEITQLLSPVEGVSFSA